MYVHQELFWACHNGKTAEAKRLIAGGAPVEYQDRLGYAPLHWASNNDMAEIIMLLLENKCNMNVTTKSGDTPLLHAALNNHMDAVRALVEAGCDITIRGYRNMTAAEFARDLGYHAISEYLRNIRFLPSADDESDKPHGARGGATRAMRRDLLQTGLLPAGPLSIIKEFATG